MRWRRILVTAVTALAAVLVPAQARAYSVLAHEALIDAAWDEHLAPALRRRHPGVSADALRTARAYAYGGVLIQDLGYYPFGSRLFSNLVHYVRSGEFVDSLIRQSRDVNESAFALGALAHYVSDNVGHPSAVNRAVPLLYPKLRAKYGDEVLYAASPERHLMLEFAFDVLQVARGTFRSDVYQELIGFEVAVSLLDRAFQDTYGLALTDVFGDVDLAVGTYRRAASRILPDVTRMAWREKRDEILKATPDATEERFVFTLTPRQYDETYGTTYRKPGLLARIIVGLFRIVPKFGPFRPLAFEPLTPDAERMFLDSFAAARARYGELLQRTSPAGARLSDTDLDTGMPTQPGVNPLADETYGDLLAKHAEKEFAGLRDDLRSHINAHYTAARAGGRMPATRDRKTARYLAAMNGAASD
jgi:hypothetical protein